MKRAKLPSGIELDYIDEGPRDGPPLIFLHGFPESHRTWRHQIAHLQGRFRCIAPDQRGYRGSSKPQDVASYSPDKLIGDIFELADVLDIDQFTIIGHDWGGAIAWGVALTGQMNGRVPRAVIANAPHPAGFARLVWLNRHQRESSQYMRTFRDTQNDSLVRDHGLLGMLMKAFDGKVITTDAMEAEERARLLQDWENRDAAFGMLNWYRASPLYVPSLDEPYAIPADRTPPPIPALTIPTLVIWAMEDLALPPENLAGLEQWVENMTLVKVPQSGHFVPWEAPQAVNAALDDFLARTA
ncbi:MAG: alpha/beta hydrolase [Sphingomonadales bacterium]|nr:alpha/beta hydrolase [Sphingomonadales bacterium]